MMCCPNSCTRKPCASSSGITKPVRRPVSAILSRADVVPDSRRRVFSDSDIAAISGFKVSNRELQCDSLEQLSRVFPRPFRAPVVMDEVLQRSDYHPIYIRQTIPQTIRGCCSRTRLELVPLRLYTGVHREVLTEN